MADAKALPPVEFRSIAHNTKCDGFRCTNSEINGWFARKAWDQHQTGSVKVTCATELGRPQRPLGFYALATVAEEIGNLPGPYHPFRTGDHFSAVQLVWLAVDKGFEGCRLGSLMAGEAIRTFARVGTIVGIPHLIVVPAVRDHARLTAFYAELGFRPYKDGQAMFLSLQAAVDGERKIQAALAALG